MRLVLRQNALLGTSCIILVTVLIYERHNQVLGAYFLFACIGLLMLKLGGWVALSRIGVIPIVSPETAIQTLTERTHAYSPVSFWIVNLGEFFYNLTWALLLLFKLSSRDLVMIVWIVFIGLPAAGCVGDALAGLALDRRRHASSNAHA